MRLRPQQNSLRGQLLVVAVNFTDHIAPIGAARRCGGLRDHIVTVVGTLLLVDQRPLDVDGLDLLLKAIGIGADLSQFLALKVA